MDIGIASSFRYKRGADWDQALGWIQWIAQHAEAHGYRTIWMTEHHFTEEVAAGSPVMLLTWLAAQTTRLRLGTAVALLPFHHPVRLAEEFLLLDRVSNGRLDIGIGRGHSPIESAVFCDDPDRSADLFDDAFQIIRQAFLGQPFAFDGKTRQFPRVELFPPPVQRFGGSPPLPVYMPITSPRSIDFVAANGIIPLVGYADPAQVTDALARYAATARASGVDEAGLAWRLERVATNRSIFLGETRAEAEEFAMRDLAHAHFSHAMYGLPAGDPGFTSRLPDDLPPLTMEQVMAGTALIGTADDVAEELLALDAMGVHHVSVAFGFRCSIEESQRNAERFTAGVLPRLRRARVAG